MGTRSQLMIRDRLFGLLIDAGGPVQGQCRRPRVKGRLIDDDR